MTHSPLRVGYVVKRYPRFSETFIVNEILAHERAGWPITIFALGTALETHFQDRISQVTAPVYYVTDDKLKVNLFWQALQQLMERDRRGVEILLDNRHLPADEIYCGWRLAESIREHRIEHLHAHFATSAATVARLAAQIADIPYTLTAHAKDIFHDQTDGAQLERKLLDSSGLVTVSDFNVRHLCQTYPHGASKVRRVYNGLCLGDFPFRDDAAKRTPLILAVGRLVEKKGFQDLVEACRLLRHEIEFHCEIIGSGPLATELQLQIDAARLGDRVRLAGPRPQRELLPLIQRAAALAAPCVVARDGDRDGLPTVLLEAMALGTPCVAANVTGVPEVVRHEDTGLLVEPHSPTALAQQLARLLRDRPLRTVLARNARRLLEESFDVDRNSAELRALFAASSARGVVGAEADREFGPSPQASNAIGSLRYSRVETRS